jgi:hypothetical protein
MRFTDLQGQISDSELDDQVLNWWQSERPTAHRHRPQNRGDAPASDSLTRGGSCIRQELADETCVRQAAEDCWQAACSPPAK